MIEPEDRYWGGSPGRTWRDASPMLEQLARADDRIPPHEVADSNRIMERMGLRTRYRPDGRPYLIDEGSER